MAITIRLPEGLQSEADAYAKSIGISLNALVAVSLRDYLSLRAPGRAVNPVSDAISESVDRSKSAPIPEVVEPSRPKAVDLSFPKVGRNDPCPCGSGKKYKLCHGRSFV